MKQLVQCALLASFAVGAMLAQTTGTITGTVTDASKALMAGVRVTAHGKTVDLQRESVPLWAYFCQISDSTTSYGSYSGAVPNEKITWGKLGKDTPKFIIESDATIVAPLIFAYILGC